MTTVPLPGRIAESFKRDSIPLVPWRGATRSACRGCGKPRKPGEVFSARGFHIECGDKIRRTNAIQLHQHKGPFFDHWRKQCLAAFGVVVLDETPSDPQTAD